MGYQALLYCPDEKLARVVSHVFSELDFSLEPAQEPFIAVKRLMAQRYDAVVIDCENETNAALLLKSARNSAPNQSSLAIALVEGQAGVAKAYRIGANLVLTKPINVEQAKGTLRVARGLLRKTSEAAPITHANPPVAPAAPVMSAAPAPVAPAAPVMSAAPAPVTPAAPVMAVAPAPVAPAVPVMAVAPPPVVPAAPVTAVAPPTIPAKAASPTVKHLAVPVNRDALPEFETPLPAMTESAKVEESPAVTPAPAPPPAANPARPVPVAVNPQATPVVSKAPQGPAASAPKGQGAAAAPAPARKAPEERKTVDFEAAYQKSHSPAFGPSSGPSFAALDVDHSEGSGGRKKIMVAAAAVLALAILGYAGWSKLSAPKTRASAPLVSAPQPQTQTETLLTAAPVAAPAAAPATISVNRADAGTQPAASPSKLASAAVPSAASNSPVLHIDMNPVPEPKKQAVAPIVVKATPARPAPARTEEPSLPSPLAVAGSDDSGLSSLTSPSTTIQPSLAQLTISQGVSQGLLIKRVQPKYPQNALAMHVQGAVQLEATIDKEGKITNLKVLKGDLILAHAAVEAVRQWRYKPYYLDGVPVEIETQITVNFKLPD